jgi:hypothetical protein
MDETGCCSRPMKAKKKVNCLLNGVWNKSSLQRRDRPQSRGLGGNKDSVRATAKTAVVDNEQSRYQGSILAVPAGQYCSLPNIERVPK